MLDISLPDLKFPDFTYGKHEIPRDLKRWIFEGGAAANSRTVAAEIDSGALGQPIVTRIALVKKIHEVITNKIDLGASRITIINIIERVGHFFRWADESKNEPSLESLEYVYQFWTDSLLHRSRFKKDLSESVAAGYSTMVGGIFDKVLNRSSPIAKLSQFRKKKRGRKYITQKQEKQNLEEVFSFGHFLLDITDGLDVDAIFGSLPIQISLRNGAIIKHWSRLKSPEKLKAPARVNQTIRNARLRDERRGDWVAEKTTRTRYPVINLRIQAEMLMLIGQSAINFSQIHRLRMDQWRYKASTQGYEIRTYKHRRWGPVIFEIYPQYRQIFERYLRWRGTIFPNDPNGLLFPLLGIGGVEHSRHPETAPAFEGIRMMCIEAGVKYIPPSALRKTNVNWMLRYTQDPDLTAEEKQHTTKVLLSSYETPSQHRATAQINTFWAKFDPTRVAPGGGSCVGRAPESVRDVVATATLPDCITPSGCHFCVHHREIDAFDHIWSLASFRFAKSLELQVHSKPFMLKDPADITLKRISEKLKYIESSTPERRLWVSEALLRVDEGRFHPAWSGLIESA